MKYIERTLVPPAGLAMPPFAPPKSKQPPSPSSPKNQRHGVPRRSPTQTIDKFKAACENITSASAQISSHDSYLINLGHPVEEALEKSRDAFIDELTRVASSWANVAQLPSGQPSAADPGR